MLWEFLVITVKKLFKSVYACRSYQTTELKTAGGHMMLPQMDGCDEAGESMLAREWTGT